MLMSILSKPVLHRAHCCRRSALAPHSGFAPRFEAVRGTALVAKAHQHQQLTVFAAGHRSSQLKSAECSCSRVLILQPASQISKLTSIASVEGYRYSIESRGSHMQRSSSYSMQQQPSCAAVASSPPAPAVSQTLPSASKAKQSGAVKHASSDASPAATVLTTPPAVPNGKAKRRHKPRSVEENRAYMLQLMQESEAAQALEPPPPAAAAVGISQAAIGLGAVQDAASFQAAMAALMSAAGPAVPGAAPSSSAAAAAPFTPTVNRRPRRNGSTGSTPVVGTTPAGAADAQENVQLAYPLLPPIPATAAAAVSDEAMVTSSLPLGAAGMSSVPVIAAAAAALEPLIDAQARQRGRRKGKAAATTAEAEGDDTFAVEASRRKRQRTRATTAAMAAGDGTTDEPANGEPAVAAAITAKPTRQRKMATPTAAAAELKADITGNTGAAAAADGAPSGEADAAAIIAAASAKPRRQRRKNTAAVSGTDDSADAAAAAAGDDVADAAAPAKPKRQRRKSTAAAAAAVNGTDGSAATAAVVKPVRRTKKVIAAEVLAAAREGNFGELTSLVGMYSHIALFASNSNSQHWDDMMTQSQPQQQQQQQQLENLTDIAAAGAAGAAGDATARHGSAPAAAAAPVAVAPSEIIYAISSRCQQQQAAGSSSSSLALCRTSGLGSYRQQVWLHSVPSSDLPHITDFGHKQQQQQPPDHRAAAAAAAITNNSTSSSNAAEAKVLPNLGYACLCMTMRQYDVFNSRDCVKKTRDGPDGLAKVSQMALANARDLVPLIRWNEAHGIRLFRLSSGILPWMSSYQPEELPDWPQIQQALRAAGDLAKQYGHRLTFHPSEYCKIAGERPAWVTQSVAELEVHSRIFDEMGFLPASPYNKINIHVGGTYGGEKEPTLRRFAAVVNDRLSPNCKARLTVENDDRASQYSVADLQLVHQLTGIPIVFDFHHWKFCKGGQTQEEAFKAAVATWPEGIRPVVHWSECPEDPDKRRSAHSEYIDGPINLYGLEGQVDVMIESKAKELALLEYRQAVLEGWQVRPRQRNSKFGAATAGPDLPPDSEGDEDEEDCSEDQ